MSNSDSSSRQSPRQPGPPRRRGLKIRPARLFIHWPLALAFAAVVLWGALAGYTATVQAYDSYMAQLPSPDNLKDREIFLTTKIFDRNGVLLSEITDPAGGNRSLVALDALPQDLIVATVAAEDQTFFTNPGFDVRGIARALFDSVRKKGIVSGASTLTQQLVRNTLLSEQERSRQTISRKVKELVLAYLVTRYYPKNQILEMYLNEVYYGNRSYGVQAAAESYFGKPARDLTLAESALLAGLPQAPSDYNPYANPDVAKKRQKYVLDRMVKAGFLTREQADAAEQEPLQLAKQQTVPTLAPHFVNYVRDLLEEKYGPETLYTGGLQVTTTLDIRLQDMAQNIAQQRVKEFESLNAHNAAVVAMNPKTGEILTMLGSVNFDDPTINGQVNVAVSERQPGSSIKPIVYISAFERGFSPATIAQDVPTTFVGEFGQIWKPVDWDFKFRGPVTIRQAIGQSLNLPAVRTLQDIGLPAFIKAAERMGITTFTGRPNLGLAIAIGGGEIKLVELTSAYNVLATMGERHESAAILKVVDGHGQVLEEFKPSPPERLFDPRLVYQLITVMSDGISRIPAFGVDSPLNLDTRIGAVKTGTTDDFRDVWTVGFTPQLTTGVWVGNANGEPMKSLTSARTAGWIWHDFMEGALKDQPVEWYDRPDGMHYADICQPEQSRGCKDIVREWFPDGTSLRGPLGFQAGPGHIVREPGVYKIKVREYPEEHADGLYMVTQWSDGEFEAKKVDPNAPPAPETQPQRANWPPPSLAQVGLPRGAIPPPPPPVPQRVKVREYPELHRDGLYWVIQWSDGVFETAKLDANGQPISPPSPAPSQPGTPAPSASPSARPSPSPSPAPAPTRTPAAPRVKVREYPEQHPDGIYVVTEYSDGTYDLVKAPN